MKKLFTICALLLMSYMTIKAQTFAFVDNNGNVIENGATLTMDEQEEGWGGVQIPLKNVSIKNVPEVNGTVNVTLKAEKMPKGSSFGYCVGMSCATLMEEGESRSFDQELPAGESVSLSPSEWIPANTEGTCSIKIKIQTPASMLPDSEITVNFVYNATSIDGIQNNADNKVVARYSINGQLLDAPQKGINILKYADGRIEKVIVK